MAKPRTSTHTIEFPYTRTLGPVYSAFALIRLDGADSALLHAVDAGSMDAMSTGMRVTPRWKEERIGYMTDLEAFVPEGSA